jgi:hypothetical protein
MCLKNMGIFLSGISEHHWYFIILALGTSHLSGYLIHPVDRSARESTWDGVEHMLIYIGISWTFKSIASCLYCCTVHSEDSLIIKHQQMHYYIL